MPPPKSSPENLMLGKGSAGSRLQAGPDMQVVMGDDHWSEKFFFLEIKHGAFFHYIPHLLHRTQAPSLGQLGLIYQCSQCRIW